MIPGRTSVTMGGGVGLALPCTFRIATENTKLAMPETGIGLFPDVGAGWYLSRLPGRIGQYLALTGYRLDGAECQALGMATHYLDSASLDEANVTRYNEAIRSMTDRSQFILITHIKRTMQSVDILYGVTMQEPGVSKLVSVRVNENVQKRGDARESAPAAAVA